MLMGGTDTFGDLDQPLCQTCYWALIDVQKERDKKAKQERYYEEQRLRDALQEAQADLDEYEIGGDEGNIKAARKRIDKLQDKIKEISK